MTVREAPPQAGTFNLATWFAGNVKAGDIVHLAEREVYDVDGFSIRGLDRIRLEGHGATLQARRPPVDAKQPLRPFELIDCDGWQVSDVDVDCQVPVDMDGSSDSTKAHQHGFAIGGCRDIWLKGCRVMSAWGDGLYLYRWGDTVPTNIVACDLTVEGSYRHGVTTTAGVDIFVNRPHLVHVARTAFNFEVHAGYEVRGWAEQDARVDHVGLRTITGTGEGGAHGVTFDGLSIAADQRFTAEVYGIDANLVEQPTVEADGELVPDPRYPVPKGRAYGPRANWTVRRVRGAIQPKTGRLDARFICVGGLTVEDVPYPIDDRGSTAA